MNMKTRFNDGWEFARSALDASDSAQLTFEPVDLPHDWLIYDTLNLYENGIGWYRKRFTWAGDDAHVLLYFEGVYMNSAVYVNQKFVGEWKYGYSSFEHEITDVLVNGENEILVKVVFQSPNSRWYSGAGIYRDVWLTTRNKTYIETDGIYISTKQDEESWRVTVDTELSLAEEIEISHTILLGDREIASTSERIASTINVQNVDDASATNQQSLIVTDPRLWSPNEPNLYQLKTDLYVVRAYADGNELLEKVESVSQNLGFRTIVLDPNQGMFLNGKKMKLNGVCEHHDLGALGAAFNKNALRRRFAILKKMGANAIRTAHNMPAPDLMDLADEMGFFVVSEAFDMWERPKTSYDYARFFKDWFRTDVRSWIRRDRNHPSLLLWSIGNEIYDTHAGERGQEVTRMLVEEVRFHDPRGNARVTIGSNYMPWENAQKCADILKVAGYNYAEKYYHTHHEEHPDWVIYGSETASVVQSRGVYHFPLEASILADDDEQCSALGNSSTSWGAKSAEACIIADRDAPFSLGQFIWTGFDYIGEPTPYHTKNSYFGQIDTATFPKDSYYIYQSAWTDYKTEPMVHIFPYWDFSPGQMIDVRVCSNAPMVELQVNGRAIGTRAINHLRGTDLVPSWKIAFEVGELKAIAYDENHQVIATAVRHSFGDAARMVLRADKNVLVADGRDLIFVEIGMEDEDGHPVENANNRVEVFVKGAGRLVGLDNGDSTDYDAYKGQSRRLFGGKLMAIIGSTLDPGEILVQVSSKGMPSETFTLSSHPLDGQTVEGVCAHTENRPLACVMGSPDEIPVRKIEMISDAGQSFDEARREIAVRARILPEDASYRDVEWRVVTDTGIDSNIAIVEPIGLEAKVTALGDGNFRVRCMSKNGTKKTKLISELEFKVTGLGTAYKDPYGFISGGLYDYSKGEVGAGNERGVATARDGETQIGFRNIDFGPYGSDTMTLPIFALSGEEYPLQIWEGMPGEEGSELVADVVYQKPSIWNTYQAETYRLSKRLRGVTSICFVLQQKVHIKGFSFEKQNRAFAKNLVLDCDRIYGDTYTKTQDSIEAIGNNVSLEFGALEFGPQGASKLVVFGHSPIDKNTIHVRFAGEEGENPQIIEFTASDGYEEREFSITRVNGTKDVTFVFLPGCNFDFGWFRFEP